MQFPAYGLHWFRRDLRVPGNAALAWSRREHGGRVLGVYCWDPAALSTPDFAANQNLFLLRTVLALKTELEARGSGLLFIDAPPAEAAALLLGHLQSPSLNQAQRLPASCSWNRGYEPAAIAMDETLRSQFSQKAILTHTECDQLLIEPHEIFKESNRRQAYQIYTPFQKQWFKMFKTAAIQERLKLQKPALRELKKLAPGPHALPQDFSLQWPQVLGAPSYLEGSQKLEFYLKKLTAKVKIVLPEAGAYAAWQQLKNFRKQLDSYHEQRDYPALTGTSRFSVYLNNGSLSVAQAIAAYDLSDEEASASGRCKFLSELIWREFYYYILSKNPYVENEAFNSRYRSLAWENRDDWFERWQEGKTGYPIVDAGMRELLETGWMHNRVRMITASFLCKDLLIDWQWGERHFMQHLLDGDPALNNGGWQWAASTGCDPQPYFRIFNPTLQSQKYDPDASYIKRYVPELAHLTARQIHAPTNADRPKSYPEPIVDHALQKIRAVALYKGSGGNRLDALN